VAEWPLAEHSEQLGENYGKQLKTQVCELWTAQQQQQHKLWRNWNFQARIKKTILSFSFFAFCFSF